MVDLGNGFSVSVTRPVAGTGVQVAPVAFDDTNLRADLALKASRGLPSYAPPTAANLFSSTLSTYNWKASNTRKIRAALGKAGAGLGVANMLFIGDSATDARTGASGVYDRLKAWPLIVRDTLAASQNIAVAGEGFVKAQQAVTTDDPRVTKSSGWSSPTGAYAQASASAKTLTFTLTKACTAIDVWYSGASGRITVAVDGASSGAGFADITPAGGSTFLKTTLSGLSAAVHTVVITTMTATATAIKGINAYSASGLLAHNMAESGWSANDWVTYLTWFQIVGSLELALPKAGQDVVFIGLGGNDIALQGRTPAQIITSMTTLINRWKPGPDIVLVAPNQADPASVPNATWDSYVGLLYTLADTFDCPLIDFHHRSGGNAALSTAGLLGDSTHMTAAGYRDQGRQVAAVLAT